MFKTADSNNRDRQSLKDLKQRIRHLEEINRFTLDALELAASLMDFQPNISKLESPSLILEETCARICRLIRFHNMAIYLVDENDSDFFPAHWEPSNSKNRIAQEISRLIEQGFFSWVMKEKRPLILASSVPGQSVVLHVMSTSSRIRGMFVGLIKGESSTIPDVSWSLLSIVLSGSANALESFELYRIFREANVKLKRSVLNRTRQLEIQASYDQLTHLPNRDMIFKKLEKEIRTCEGEDQDHQVAFILIDLDMFKEVNESLGHDMGDKLLVQVGFRLQEIMDDQECLARLGGDEFAVILSGPDAESRARQTASEIIRIMAEPFEMDRQSLVLDVSIGIAVYPRDGKNLGQILSKADVAMYASKRKKTGYTIYESHLDSSGLNRLSLMGELKQGLDRNELVLFYQPKISLSNQEPCGAEALVRWLHPTRGLILPDEFIPLAEQGGIIKELTHRVMLMAAKQISHWRNLGVNLPLSINLSARDIQDSGLPEQVFQILDLEKIPPAMLEMEITESAFMTSPGKGLRVLNALNRMGVGLSIDDFGTGYSSIAYLKELPVKVLKIDRSFVKSMDKDENDRKIVKSIIDLAHNLDLRIVAEGVENKSILHSLSQMGCDMAQGFHIMKPGPADEFVQWFRTWNKA
ncbi:bifunctional diguanylate cyclase/phosphodiesterase [Desulfonatronovibrio hydrogenovorans]|uniref:bifunctional diguanylate cyclase/phosphodiesterase n=1 Tax=Desulfonatronovibrio hydrogenovorans TaxID=53245 RepID=UPI0006915657|nr:EAL domain-containing protein [Desulfonatronovibrio hydrogenovorans]